MASGNVRSRQEGRRQDSGGAREAGREFYLKARRASGAFQARGGDWLGDSVHILAFRVSGSATPFKVFKLDELSHFFPEIFHPPRLGRAVWHPAR